MKVVVAYGAGQMRGTRIAFGKAQRLRSAATRILAKTCPCGQWRADAARFRATGSPPRGWPSHTLGVAVHQAALPAGISSGKPPKRHI